ncbi:MAG: hotdog fold thioesterase [Bacteroidota bacterium]|jgi:1,4-dihydroxy-2-naphthoyl-CoA hydrolase
MSIFKIDSKVTLDAINRRNENTIASYIGIEVYEIGEDFIKAKMPVDHRTVQALRVVNGGSYCVLAETLGSVAGNLCLDRDKYVALGLDINANHVRSVSSGYVHATAKPFHLGRTTHVWEIKITDDENKLCSICRLTLSIVEIKNDNRNFKPVKV